MNQHSEVFHYLQKENGKAIKLLTERQVAVVTGLREATLRQKRFYKLPPEFIKVDKRIFYTLDTIKDFIKDQDSKKDQ